MAGRRQRPRTGDEEVDALRRRRRRREETQRAFEPPCGSRGGARGDLLSSLAQDGDGGHVALARAALYVVRARWGRGTTRRERLGAALMRTEPPSVWCCLVDGSAHERVPEAKAAGDVRVADEVERQQIVKCLDGRCLGYRRRGCRQLGLERVACHRGPLQHTACVV